MIRQTRPSNTQSDKTQTTVYHGLTAARYDSLYQLCLHVEKHRMICLYACFKQLETLKNMGLNQALFAGNSEPFSARLRYTGREQSLLLATFQFIAYKNFQRMRGCLNKLIENRKIRKLHQIVILYKRLKRIGTNRIVDIWENNKNVKAKARAIGKWRRYVKYKEAEEFVKTQETRKRDFENKIVEHRRTLILNTEAESVKRKGMIISAETQQVKIGDLIGCFESAADMVLNSAYRNLTQFAKEDNFAAFSAEFMDSAINMYLQAFSKLNSNDIEKMAKTLSSNDRPDGKRDEAVLPTELTDLDMSLMGKKVTEMLFANHLNAFMGAKK